MTTPDNRRANATALTGVALVGGGGALREKALQRAYSAHYKNKDKAKRLKKGPRPAFASRRLLDMPGPAKGRTQALYAGGTAIGLVGTTAMAHGLLHRNKVQKSQGFISEGLAGTREAVELKGHELTDPKKKRSKKATVIQGGVAVGTALGAGKVASMATARAMPKANMRRAMAGAVLGSALGVATVPFTNKIVNRKKRAPKSPSSAAHIIDGRHGASQARFRSEVVPTDVRKAQRKKIDRTLEARKKKMHDPWGDRHYALRVYDHEVGIRAWERREGHRPGTFVYGRKNGQPSWGYKPAKYVPGRQEPDFDEYLGSRKSTSVGPKRNPTPRKRVSKLDTNYSGYGMNPRKKRALVTAAGAAPGLGDFASAATAARLAPPEQRRRVAVTQFAGSAAGGYGGAALGGGAGFLAVKHNDRLAKPAEKLAQHAANVTNPARKLVGLAPKVAGKGRWAGAAVGALAGSTVLGQVGQQKTYSHVLRMERERNARLAKRAPIGPEMSLADQRRQLKRKKRNAAIGAFTNTLGVGSAGTFIGSFHAKKPHVVGGLRTASLGLGVTAGAVGGLNGLNGYRIQRKDFKAQEKALAKSWRSENVAKAAWMDVEKARKKKKWAHPSENLGTKPGQWRVVTRKDGGVLYEQIPLDYDRVQRRKARAAGVGKALAPRPRLPSMRPPAPVMGLTHPVGTTRAKTYRSSALVTRRSGNGIIRTTTRTGGIG